MNASLHLANAIGGYFELESTRQFGEFYPTAIRYQSARAAFTALLDRARPRRIWLPWYTCGTMLEGPKRLGIEIERYRLDGDLLPLGLDRVAPNDWVLYINYFGVCSTLVDRVLADLDPERVVVDHSQAFYAPPAECVGTIYSPRKFFGVPDGGYLNTSFPIEPPVEQDTGSFARLKPLLIRLSEGPEAGYGAVQEARGSLRNQSPMRMSALTKAMLERIDYASALIKRNANFESLHRALGGLNRFPLPPGPPSGPMCYPYLGPRPGLHEWLIGNRVYVGRYWPDMGAEAELAARWERELYLNCVPLPCDQRYGQDAMVRIIELVRVFEASRLHQ